MNWTEDGKTQPGRRRSVKEKRDTQNTVKIWALEPSKESAAYGAFFSLGVASMIGGVSMIGMGYLSGIIFISLGSGMFGYGLWGSATLALRLRSFEHTVLVDEDEEEVIPAGKEPKTPHEHMVKWRMLTGEYTEFLEPDPGEFARFAQLALDENSGVTLSLRQGRDRGWPTAMHKAMMAQLLDRGIVHQGKNQAPVITNKGRNEINSYIRMGRPHPNGKI